MLDSAPGLLLSLAFCVVAAVFLAKLVYEGLAHAAIDAARKPSPPFSRDDLLRDLIPGAVLAAAIVGPRPLAAAVFLTAWACAALAWRPARRRFLAYWYRFLKNGEDPGESMLALAALLFFMILLPLWEAVESFRGSPAHASVVAVWLTAVVLWARSSRRFHWAAAAAVFASLGLAGHLYVSRSIGEVQRNKGVNAVLGWRHFHHGPE